jgi:MFS family permease
MGTVETAKDRRRMVRRAGHPSTSLLSAAAGTLAAFGLLVVVFAIVGATGSRYGLSLDGVDTGRWRGAEVGWAVAATAAVFIAALFGGYTAGRMSWRAGARHGLVAYLLGAALIGIVATVARWADDATFSGDAGADIWVTALAMAGVALVGFVVGGVTGERWHTRLARAASRTTTPAATPTERPQFPLGQDPTTAVDLTREARQPSVEEEREAARQARADVGM